MSEYNLRSAAAIGTGLMGPGTALTLALGGLETTIVSRDADRAAAAAQKARALAQFLAANELIDESAAAGAAQRLTGSADFDEAIAAADIVIESALEDMALKQQLFARMDGLNPRAILATNTSALSITQIASGCTRPERVLTTHFWNPPHLIPLVEIVQGERTSPAAADAVHRLLRSCGKTPVTVRKDRRGQIGNRLQMALVREAVNIVAEGIADANDVDTVIRDGLGIRMPAYGTLEHMDVAGLDLALSINDYVVADLYNEPRAPETLRQLVRSGNLGVKTGRGFYDWSTRSADAVKAARDAFLVEVLRYRRGLQSRQTNCLR